MNKDELKQYIQDCIQNVSLEKIKACMEQVHPADIAEVLPAFSLPQRLKILRSIEPASAALVLFEIEREFVAELLEGLGRKRSAEIFSEMSTDDAADILLELPVEERKRVLSFMAATDVHEVQELLRYEADTAGGIMATEFVAISKEITVERAIEDVRKFAQDAETVYYVYVVNNQGQLVGVISLRELILAKGSSLIEEIMNTNVRSVHVRTDQEEVARVAAKYDFLAVPVVNDKNELLGIITIDDILDVIEEEATEDILKLSANIDTKGYDFDTSVLYRSVRRLPWLVVLLFGALVAGSVIDRFSSALQALPILAAFITVMAGGPGNAATQTLTVVVRGLGTGEIDTSDVLSVILKEVRVGLVLGLATGLILAIVAVLWKGSPVLGIVVGLSLLLNIIVGTMLGSLVPVVINKLGIDPALASGPFITTIIDITSMAIFFSLAVLMLF